MKLVINRVKTGWSSFLNSGQRKPLIARQAGARTKIKVNMSHGARKMNYNGKPLGAIRFGFLCDETLLETPNEKLDTSIAFYA